MTPPTLVHYIISEAHKVTDFLLWSFGVLTKYTLNHGMLKKNNYSPHSPPSALNDPTIVNNIRANRNEVMLVSHPCEVLVLYSELSDIREYLETFGIIMPDRDRHNNDDDRDRHNNDEAAFEVRERTQPVRIDYRDKNANNVFREFVRYFHYFYFLFGNQNLFSCTSFSCAVLFTAVISPDLSQMYLHQVLSG